MKNKKKESFDSDYFDRKFFAQNLYQLIKNQYKEDSQEEQNEEYERIRVISIKSDFGYGKTYFAKAFKNLIDSDKENKNPYLLCHYIDIWREDYNHNPLLAILSSLNDFLDAEVSFISTETKNKLKEAGKTLCIEFLKERASRVPIIGKSTSKAIDAYVNYDNKSIFRDLNALKKVANKIKQTFDEFKNCHIVVIIDEIDRCHPEYAIEFLETLKHFFDVDNLYFLVMMNENHIKEKIKEKFKYIDFNTWKDKFINLEFELPNAKNQEKFLNFLMNQKCQSSNKLNIKNFDFSWTKIKWIISPPTIQKEMQDHSTRFGNNETYSWDQLLISLSKTANINLNNRQIISIFSHLGVALGVLKNKPIYPLLLLGTILKNYFPKEKISCDTAFEWFVGAYREEGIVYCHCLEVIALLIPTKNEQEVLFYGKKAFITLADDEIENILAAQFALQSI